MWVDLHPPFPWLQPSITRHGAHYVLVSKERQFVDKSTRIDHVNVYSEPGICCTTFAGNTPGTITVPGIPAKVVQPELCKNFAHQGVQLSSYFIMQDFHLPSPSHSRIRHSCYISWQRSWWTSSVTWRSKWKCLIPPLSFVCFFHVCVCVDSAQVDIAFSHLCTRVVSRHWGRYDALLGARTVAWRSGSTLILLHRLCCSEDVCLRLFGHKQPDLLSPHHEQALAWSSQGCSNSHLVFIF
jgi:hypothetical protein